MKMKMIVRFAKAGPRYYLRPIPDLKDDSLYGRLVRVTAYAPAGERYVFVGRVGKYPGNPRYGYVIYVRRRSFPDFLKFLGQAWEAEIELVQ
jgi:hypothetical protein